MGELEKLGLKYRLALKWVFQIKYPSNFPICLWIALLAIKYYFVYLLTVKEIW